MNEIKYKIVRSARKTVAISIKDGNVVVRAPIKLAEKKIDEFVLAHKDWIIKKVEHQNMAKYEYSNVKNLKTVLIFGREKRLILGACKNYESDFDLYLKDISDIRRYFEKNYTDYIFETLYSLARTIGEMPAMVRIRDFKTKWGACDERGIININWRLLFLPPEVQRYVFIHELCHLRCFNHSKEFWSEVGRYCPEYKKIKNDLKSYSFLTYIYR